MKQKKGKFFLYSPEFIQEVINQKFYFTEKRGPAIRAVMHKGEDLRKQLQKDKKDLLKQLSKLKRESNKKKVRQTIKEINFLKNLFKEQKKN